MGKSEGAPSVRRFSDICLRLSFLRRLVGMNTALLVPSPMNQSWLASGEWKPLLLTAEMIALIFPPPAPVLSLPPPPSPSMPLSVPWNYTPLEQRPVAALVPPPMPAKFQRKLCPNGEFTPGYIRRYACPVCHKKFTQAEDLRRHYRIHTGEVRHCLPQLSHPPATLQMRRVWQLFHSKGASHGPPETAYGRSPICLPRTWMLIFIRAPP